MNIEVDKHSLIEKLTENRRQHAEVYILAKEGHKVALIEELTKHLAEAEEGKDVPRWHNLSAPVDNTEDYDVALAMVELSSGSTVELDAEDFSHFILDKWGWKDSFTGTAGYAVALASGKLAGFSNYSS